MLGDKIVVKEHHTRAAEGVVRSISGKLAGLGDTRIAITVAGESGSGKSEIAHEIARLALERNNMKSIILHQDDYFKLPPKSNDQARRKDIGNVGMHEVRLELLDEHISIAKKQDLSQAQGAEVSAGNGETLCKPLIDYDNDDVLEENISIADMNVVLAEGTYTTVLKNADIKVFIDRNYMDTLEHRKERARDNLDDYNRKIMIIEHDIISKHKEMADIIIDKEYNIV